MSLTLPKAAKMKKNGDIVIMLDITPTEETETFEDASRML